MTSSENKKPWKDIIKYEFSSARKKQKIFNDTIKWMQTDEKVQAYLNQFNQVNIYSSIESYAWQKSRWLTDKDKNEDYLEDAGYESKKEAWLCLGNILQQKLF